MNNGHVVYWALYEEIRIPFAVVFAGRREGRESAYSQTYGSSTYRFGES